MRKLLLAAWVLITAATTSLSAKDITTDIEMFPKAKKGYKQVYIQVPQKKSENDFKVEIFAGRNELVDCNRHFMLGSIKEEVLDGWGYNYYTIDSKGTIGGTKMACPDNKKTMQFIHIQPQMLRYNSKLPIVIYVPENMEVKYRIWSAGKKMIGATTNTKAPITSSNNTVEDKKWQLVELNGKAVKGNANTHYLIFHSKGKRVEAKANCNILSMSYEMKNEFQIKFGEGLSTMMACPDNLEQEFLEMLKNVDNLSTDGKSLTLNKARMAPLAKFKLVK